MTTPRPLGPGGPRQHHFIPRWFLENFTESNKIARVRIGGGGPPVITTVGNVASERDLYTITLPDTGRTAMVEERLAIIDGAAASPVRQLIESTDLNMSDEARQAVLTLVASLWVRGPRWRRQQEALGDMAIKWEIGVTENIPDVQRILIERLGRDVSLEQAAEIKDQVAAGTIEFASISEDITLRMLEKIDEGSVDLRYYRWEVIRGLPSQLVLPDTPVVVQPVMRSGPSEHRPRGWSAIQLPLSPTTLLCLLPPAATEFSPRDYLLPRLDLLRREIANWCFQEVYCAPSAANEAAALVAGRPTSPLGVTDDKAPNFGVRVDGLDSSPIRERHHRVSWAMDQAETLERTRRDRSTS